MRAAFLPLLFLAGCYPDEAIIAPPQPVPHVPAEPVAIAPVPVPVAPRPVVLKQSPGGTIQAGRHTFPEYLTMTITGAPPSDADLVGQSVRLRWRLAELIERYTILGLSVPVMADGYYYWIGDVSFRPGTINRVIINPGRTWDPAPVEPIFACASCSLHLHPTTWVPLQPSRTGGQCVVTSFSAAPFGFSGRMQGLYGNIDFTVR